MSGLACPNCGCFSTVDHCPTKAKVDGTRKPSLCDWFVCKRCGTYGKRDVTRWVQGDGRAA